MMEQMTGSRLPDGGGVCRGLSRLQFRGPCRAPAADYCAALGGDATYGRFVAEPWPQRLGQLAGRPVLNLGAPHAGPDAWLGAPELIRLARSARLRLIQVPDAVNLGNPLYRVHPWRNDRFLEASPQLRQLYPEVDFMEFAFTRHMIRSLARHGPRRFAVVAQILGQSWLTRMGQLLEQLGRPTVLLWFADRRPPLPGERLQLRDGAPLLVDAIMLQALAARTAGLVEVVVPDDGRPGAGKVFAPAEAAAARLLPGPAAHAAIAQALVPWLRPAQ